LRKQFGKWRNEAAGQGLENRIPGVWDAERYERGLDCIGESYDRGVREERGRSEY